MTRKRKDGGDRSSRLDLVAKPGQTPEATIAELSVRGIVVNAYTAEGYLKKLMGELDLNECVGALTAATEKVQRGDLTDLEAMLGAQAITLNAIFTQLARKTSQMTLVDQIDRFTRLALKAQGQCRATVETLALMKNPPVFARQANIAHGPQQVNNGVAPPSAPRAEIPNSRENRLLEADGERLDPGAARPAGAGDQELAAVGAVHRAADR